MVKRFQDLGVQRFMISPAGPTEDSIRKGLDEFADRVIAKL